jgi:hypothetical protein
MQAALTWVFLYPHPLPLHPQSTGRAAKLPSLNSYVRPGYGPTGFTGGPRPGCMSKATLHSLACNHPALDVGRGDLYRGRKLGRHQLGEPLRNQDEDLVLGHAGGDQAADLVGDGAVCHSSRPRAWQRSRRPSILVSVEAANPYHALSTITLQLPLRPPLRTAPKTRIYVWEPMTSARTISKLPQKIRPGVVFSSSGQIGRCTRLKGILR